MAEQDPRPKVPAQSEGTSLETQTTKVTGNTDSDVLALEENPGVTPITQPKPIRKQTRSEKILSKTHGVNIYLILFIVILAIAVIIMLVAFRSDDSRDSLILTGEDLSQQTLEELIADENRIGEATQTLTVEANAIFNGKVLVKDDLDVAGSINVGGPLTLPGITVAGTSAFDEVEVSNNLTILGNASVQGSLTIQSGLSVTGDTSIKGALNVDSLSTSDFELTGDLKLTRHIDTGGPVPGASRGAGSGNGGTVSISGTDSAGTVTINTGSGASGGVLATINFANNFGGTPHVVISPLNSSAANVKYYVTRGSSSFTIRAAGSVPNGATLSFDYLVME